MLFAALQFSQALTYLDTAQQEVKAGLGTHSDMLKQVSSLSLSLCLFLSQSLSLSLFLSVSLSVSLSLSLSLPLTRR